ncbi:MAG: hypothetical protein HPY53_01630 [Brevinematales bacterium]|nr:hypothetical protein [Brevinematales bacterium]
MDTPILRNVVDMKGVTHLLLEGEKECLCENMNLVFTEFGLNYKAGSRPNLFEVTCPECLAALRRRFEGINVIPQECQYIPHEWIEGDYIVYESANREVVTVKNYITGKEGQDWTKEGAIARTL